MPPVEYDKLRDMIRNRPDLVVELYQEASGIELPRYDLISVPWIGFVDQMATVLIGDLDQPDLMIHVELLSEIITERRYSWPSYLARHRAYYKCPVTMVVLCADEATAEWCRQPIECGLDEGWVLRPWALNLADVPAVTDLDKARAMPELTVLSILAHADGPDQDAVLTAFAEAMSVVDLGDAWRYQRYIRSQLSESARSRLDEISYARGKAKGGAEVLFTVLDTLGFTVDDALRKRITTCRDYEQIRTWMRRAFKSQTLDEIFG
ncbi:hypothetical protein [Actinomadura chokoriensis]|uniref:hypothetical protein n=1 Tax=Actinomadura chokoriensis TaxID=454156 RepID=UPI0031F772BC